MPVSKEELDAWNAEADRKILLEQIEGNITPEEFSKKERQKWRWSGSIPRGVWLTANDLAADFNTGITSLLGPTAQDWLSEIGIGRPYSQAPYMGIVGAGAEMAAQGLTMAATMGAGLTASTTMRGFGLLQTAQNPSLTGRIGADLARSIERNPGTFFAGEALGGFGSGAAMEAASGEGQLGEAAGLLGGVVAGSLPMFGFNFGRRALNWSLSHVAPWLDGGETLAAARVQKLAADPIDAAAKARKAPAGVSPARATGDKNLMALEARILADDPASEAEFTEALERARQAASQELRDFNGSMRQPGEWERAVIQRVAADGTEIKLSDPHAMLKQARKSFAPVYNQFEGYPVKPLLEVDEGDIPIDQVFKSASMDDTILASDSERLAARKYLIDELSRLKSPTGDKLDVTIDSGKLLFVRQNIRERVSSLTAKRDRGSHVTARILSNAEAAITKLFQQQLPGEALSSLQQIDNQYNTYRIVEQAVTTAGEKKLSPSMMGKAIREASPRTANDLRKLARAGRDVGSALNDPRSLKLMVQGQPGSTRKQIQSDYFHEMWQRSLTKEFDDGDSPLVSGDRYLHNLIAHKEAANALGIPKDEYNRAVEIAKQIKMMEAKSPQALRQTLEDSPATMLQLAATLVGAKWGTRMSQMGPGGGMGSSLVMAQFGSQRARRWMSTWFRDDATDILIKASKNKELYAALLTKSTAKVSEQERAVRVISAWMGPTAMEALENADEGDER